MAGGDVVAGPVGELRAASTAGGGTALSTTAAFIQLPLGAHHVFIAPRNFSTAVVAKVAFNPWLWVLKTSDGLGTNKGWATMAVLDSQEARRQFTSKLDAEEDASPKDHYFYIFRLGDTVAATTKISRGPRHTISDDLVARMARQLGVSGKALSEAVSCELSAEDFYRLMAMGVPFRKRRLTKKKSRSRPQEPLR